MEFLVIPFMFPHVCHGTWTSAISWASKNLWVEAVAGSVDHCHGKKLQIYISATDQPLDRYAILRTLKSIVHFHALGFRTTYHWPTVLIITSVTFIWYCACGFLIWSTDVFFFCILAVCYCLKLYNRNLGFVFRNLVSTYNEIFLAQRFYCFNFCPSNNG